MRKLLSIVALLAFTSALSAQFVEFGGASNGQKGVMFAVDNISLAAVTITSLDVKFLAAGTANVEVYAANGSFVGNETSALFWGTPVATATGLAHVAGTAGLPGNLTPLGLALAIPVPAASRVSLFVACTAATASNVFYTSGVGQYNTTIATDGVLNLIGGVGKGYPVTGATFGLPTAGRLFNGRVNYMPAGPPTYDTNTAGCSLDANGVLGSGFSPANSTHCVGNLVNINLGTNQAPMNFELAYNLAALVPLGGGGLPAGTSAIVNIDLTSPTFFLNGGVAPAVAPSPGPFTLGFPMPAVPAPGISAQYAQFSAASPDGFELSQGVNIQSVNVLSMGFGSAADDGATVITAGTAPTTPTCFSAFPAIPFYGTNETTVYICSNGRVTFRAVTNTADFTPTVAEGLTQTGFVGFWCDLEPNLSPGGTTTINWTNPAAVTVTYTNIRYWGNVGLTITGSIIFDTVTGAITLTGMNTFPLFPVTVGSDNNMFLGITPGNFVAGTTNPGAATFAPAPSAGGAAAATDMLYNFGQAGTLAPGVASITFTPAAGNYTFTTL